MSQSHRYSWLGARVPILFYVHYLWKSEVYMEVLPSFSAYCIVILGRVLCSYDDAPFYVCMGRRVIYSFCEGGRIGICKIGSFRRDYLFTLHAYVWHQSYYYQRILGVRTRVLKGMNRLSIQLWVDACVEGRRYGTIYRYVYAYGMWNLWINFYLIILHDQCCCHSLIIWKI